MAVRRASHAGTWYTDDDSKLNNELNSWLDKATMSHSPAKAIISPHAGYSYSGPCAAFAFRNIDPTNIDKVFVLGPSHHARLTGCALTQTQTYSTPLYDLIVDQEVNKKLSETGKFELMSLKVDEDEHSIEMQLPYIAKVMESKKGKFTVIPILVGHTNLEKEKIYGEILSSYFAQPNTLFVISSDFCHWGERFSYTYYDKSCGEIWQSIESLDKLKSATEFKNYLQEYDNTICGRNPISVLLAIIEVLKSSRQFDIKFVQYAQSSKCRRSRDSSVSYASASVIALN